MEILMLIVSFLLILFATAYKYDPAITEHNLNQNQTAANPLDFWGEWTGHDYTASPQNWRFPFYTLFLDRFVNGDPYNDNINATVFERVTDSNQMRHGGDLQGLVDSLDYLQGMRIKGIYIAGSPFMNQPWRADSYSPLDLSILDLHFGTIDMWRLAINEIHAHGMYVILDNTFATLGDLIGFEEYLNETVPFSLQEHQVRWKSARRYMDFDFGNEYNETCQYPRFWNETGYPIDLEVKEQMKGCYDSEFDQYGDTEAFGVYPDWRRQLSRFASVQDRLREWKPEVRVKIEHFYCMAIAQLDFDGYRYDKAVQATVDALAVSSEALRECARRYGKENFLIVGEVTSGNSLGSVYFGRGRQPDQLPENMTLAVSLTHNSSNASQYYIREQNASGLDGGAFHYTTYRALTRFLGMDGNLEAGYDAPVNWVDQWNTFLLTNDLINPNTGLFDPRHMFGVSNQDVFRWPAIVDGVHRQLLGSFITTLLLPGVPKLLWGEEQQFYVLDSTDNNYIFGRQPMSTATAWQTHGCYSLDSSQFYKMPLEATRHGCDDDTVSIDHRDPSAPVRNILRRMYHLREAYGVLNDGFFLQQLSNQTWDVVYPGSGGVITETGLWSVLRSEFPEVQNLTQISASTNESISATPVWLVYSNYNTSHVYEFDCRDNSTGMNTTSLIAPYSAGTTVKNLFHPYDEHTLVASTRALGLADSTDLNGCLDSLTMAAYDHRAYVPKDVWVGPKPVITNFTPGHDARLLSRSPDPTAAEDLQISLEFSLPMDCGDVTSSISISSRTEGGNQAYVDSLSVQCGGLEGSAPSLVGYVPSAWSWSATIKDVANGVHRLIVDHPRAAVAANQSDTNLTTDARDHFLFRIGQPNNPIVFTRSANYSTSLLVHEANRYMLNHSAAGADLFRYSTDFGNTFSQWAPYQGGSDSITQTGKGRKSWTGEHVRVEYFSRLAGSSSHVQQGDLRSQARRFPHLYLNGPYNSYGYDAGLDSRFELIDDYTWRKHFMAEWTNNGTVTQVNVWNNQSVVMGDVDGDSVLDRLPPSALAPAVLNITAPPPLPYIAWSYVLNDGNLRFRLEPVGNMWQQLALYVSFWGLPLVSGIMSAWIFIQSFYKIKFNEIGITEKLGLWRLVPNSFRRRFRRLPGDEGARGGFLLSAIKRRAQIFSKKSDALMAQSGSRRKVLIATMEYDIEDWGIKIKIGGLGVMAQLMARNLDHQDLIWVVPCAGGIDYPTDEVAMPMTVACFGQIYDVNVQYHRLRNITYVLLDAPIFRQQSREEPYPKRMDDLDSAIYYSAWNQCIAQALVRFPVDLYHINDYHGTVAPLYLLPRTIPVCLSLHNAEFQGLWPMRTKKERDEVCSVFNLPPDIVSEYIQFGEVFNLLHAGASYLRLHQEGFGAVGVSKKYGARAYTRYPIFWGLKEIRSLQNPDPSDTGAWDKTVVSEDKGVQIDEDFEKQRLGWRVQAQEWAGLEQDPEAELFVFVGRWSMQKGIDLIADAFPAILESYPRVQLITIGPVIDLYGKFAALKLDVLMKQYPKRVCSKPVFTALPPFVFSGAEFALIPSRDEPFGLVAVEFGRKGALGVGARVGGLGQMPGWWYTVESTTAAHLLNQFKNAIRGAMSSSRDTRALMRARSAKQRFPVVQWVEELETLQSTAIRTHERNLIEKKGGSSLNLVHPHPSIHPTVGIARHASYGLADGPGHVTDGERSELISCRRTDLSTTLLSDHSNSITPLHSATSTPLMSRRTSYFLTPADAPPVPGISDESRGLGSPRPSIHSLRSPNPDSQLSMQNIVGEKNDYNLQKVDPFFTDTNGHFYERFSKRLETLDGKNSETSNCIEEFLVKSEKEWFNEIRNAKLGLLKNESSTSLTSHLRPGRVEPSEIGVIDEDSTKGSSITMVELGDKFTPPKGLRKWMQVRVLATWPLYAYFLALGQIIAANSYQVTLLTGEVGEPSTKLYAVASIYLISSAFWWILFRRFASALALSLPFLFYGMAFFLVGLAQHAPTSDGVQWVQNVGTGFYAFASASGALFFALNFGDEGGAPQQSWVLRACLVQGAQQIYVVALWYWGTFLARRKNSGSTADETPVLGPWKVTAITLPIAAVLWMVCLVMWLGLPAYYRQAPGTMPSFYKSIARRKVIMWFFVTAVVQNFFLSAPYGRNWAFLFNSHHAKGWQILILVVVFFVVVWGVFCGLFAWLTKSHSWILPLFAIGLGAPRWAQIWWGTSNIGLWLPWAPGSIETGTKYIASALLSRSLWLWLGVLDAIQGVGLGMIMLGTLTRTHVAFVITAMQVIGSAATMLARAIGPNRLGPGPISPDISGGAAALWQGWFWVGLTSNLALCVGFYKFYRKEQLTKP